MIYTKKANFPYPVLINDDDDYKNSNFDFDVNLKENIDEFIIEIEWSVSSDYIHSLIKSGEIGLVLVIKSKDNQFYKLRCGEKITQNIKKSRLCLNARTVMQLMLISNSNINFKDNYDLNDFYDEIKSEINIEKGHIIGYSNTVIFNGNMEKPYEIFEKQIDPNLKSDIAIRLGHETIIILYKDKMTQLLDLPRSKELNYPYIYLGLQKALIAFLMHECKEDDIEDGVLIDEIEIPENPLDAKLYSLMKAKSIYELNFENLDEVIHAISDNVIRRYTEIARRLSNGD